MIPSGIGDVKYSLVISANENWLIDLSEIITTIT